MSSTRKFNDDVDELFKRPLAEFIDARNTLAKQLKQSGRADDANLVKTLAKPSVSAWTVNQLYWQHREAFDTLIAAGQRFRKAQTSGKVADMRGALDSRREALAHLSDLATSLLEDGGHNASPDMIRRVVTTLEAMSAFASLSDGPTPGRLSQDVDPPGFESLASFVPGTMKTTAKPAVAQKPDISAREVRKLEETRQVKIAAARASVHAAKRSLADAKVRAQTLESAHKKAYAEAKQAEKQLRDAEERFKKAKAASETAAKRSQSMAAEAEEATQAVEDAKRAVDNASKELEWLFSESI